MLNIEAVLRELENDIARIKTEIAELNAEVTELETAKKILISKYGHPSRVKPGGLTTTIEEVIPANSSARAMVLNAIKNSETGLTTMQVRELMEKTGNKDPQAVYNVLNFFNRVAHKIQKNSEAKWVYIEKEQ